MTKKRWRIPKVRPGELAVKFGKPGRWNTTPDVCYCWGPGVNQCDGSLLYLFFGVDRLETDYDAPLGSPRYLWTKSAPSLLKELEARGYDLTTLRFSIQKKPSQPSA
jgi:hypothetical protein